jgi:hypothetical protein
MSKQQSDIMLLSWQLQRRKNYSRSRSLLAAWAIYLNEDLLIFRLIKKHTRKRKYTVNLLQLTLFP